MNKSIINLSYLVIGIFILLSSCTKSSIDEKQFIGDWEAIKGDYQEISFLKEGNKQKFTAHLTDRLFTEGTWSIKGNDIILKLKTGETVVWKDVKIENGILSFDNAKHQYRRAQTLQQKISSLITSISSIEGINFSKPIDKQFKWNFEGIGEKELTGKMIKANITLTTDDYTDISNASRKVSEILKSKGFTLSDYNMTEIQTGFEKGPIKVVIIQKTPESFDAVNETAITLKGKTAYLEIICGCVK